MKYDTAAQLRWNARRAKLDEAIRNLETLPERTPEQTTDLAALRAQRAESDRTNPRAIAAQRRRSHY